MDASRSQFLIMVGEIGRQARLAQLPIEVVTRDDRAIHGIPAPHEADGSELDDTGLARHFTVGEVTIDLDDVVEVRVSSP